MSEPVQEEYKPRLDFMMYGIKEDDAFEKFPVTHSLGVENEGTRHRGYPSFLKDLTSYHSVPNEKYVVYKCTLFRVVAETLEKNPDDPYIKTIFRVLGNDMNWDYEMYVLTFTLDP